MGPWSHGAWGGSSGEKLGAVDFYAKTGEFYREKIELPFLKYFLKGGTNFDLPKAYVFETGTDQWRRYNSWPPTNTHEQVLYFHPAGVLSTSSPAASAPGFDEYISDPGKPVPFIPNIAVGMAPEYMVDDQRFAATRPDVLVYQTDVLDNEVTFACPVAVRLQVSTTGTDSDWVVKLIDVYSGDHPNPTPNPQGAQMGWYQQLVRGEPFRRKFRNSFAKPEPFEPGKAVSVEFTMPDVYHTFLRGHRIMVHVQSSWFPLMDRNPQTFCDIYHARPEDFKKATQRVYHSSQIQVRVLENAGP